MTPDKNILDWILHLWPILGAVGLLFVAAVVQKIRVDRLYDASGEPNYITKQECDKKEVELKAGTSRALEWKRALYDEDGMLRYVTKKECERNMDGIQECIDKDVEHTGKFLLIEKHDDLCSIRLLKFERAITEVIDNRLKVFGENLIKELHNGNRKEI